MKQMIELSIVIATFNSAKTLPQVLVSIKKQSFSSKLMEIIVVDGGSHDKTLGIARKFGCRIIKNTQTEPVYGKFIAYKKAKGRYLMYIDHDEELLNPESISWKIAALRKNKKAKAIAGGNYENPEGYPFINSYINEFGDPFSFFVYRLSKSSKHFLSTMKKRYPLTVETSQYAIFDISKARNLPIIELVAGGSMFDAERLKKDFPKTKKDFKLLPHYFYLLFSRYKSIIVMKNDPIRHYSSDTIKKYLVKINWRIKNNIYFKNSMGESGFYGRERYQPFGFRIKKYLFIPYTLSIAFPLIDSISLSFTRKNFLYFIHFPLCFYTSALIVYHYLFKILGNKPYLKSYDNKKTIQR